MGEYPGGWACLKWYERVPLPAQWDDTSEDFRDRVLAFWIRASETDEWTFAQLRDLLGRLHEADEVPAALQAWANEVVSGRRQEHVGPGRKPNPNGDFRLARSVIWMTELGMSKRQAYRMLGEAMHRSPQAVESAVRRGLRWPPGA